MKVFKKITRWVRKLRVKRNRRRALIYVGAAAALIITIHTMTQPKIDPHAYKPLLDTIAKGESKGNYNAYFGNGANTAIKFTEMSIAQVLQWQRDYVSQGKASNAVGRYQFLGTTLQGLVNRLKLNPQVKFDEAMQDRLAIALLEKRGVFAYVDDKLSREQFAANLAMEWASLPKINGPNPEQSYYAKDGLNRAHVSINEIITAVEGLKKKA